MLQRRHGVAVLSESFRHDAMEFGALLFCFQQRRDLLGELLMVCELRAKQLQERSRQHRTGGPQLRLRKAVVPCQHRISVDCLAQRFNPFERLPFAQVYRLLLSQGPGVFRIGAQTLLLELPVDSLGLVEFVTELERDHNVSLLEQAWSEDVTCGDIVRIVLQSKNPRQD